MATETRTFHIGDILSVIHDRLVSPTRMDGLYQLLDWMTGDNLYTHQMPRASGECVPALRAQHPDLAAVVIPVGLEGEEPVMAWLAEQVAIFGETRQVAPLPAADHTHINPIAELAMKRPDMRVIGIEVDREDGDA